MKFAVMTDIHGNSPALKAVLRELDHRQDIEHIYCLGDMISIGPDSNEVLEMLFSREDLSMITGNHDETVLALIKGEDHPPSHPHVREHHEWIAERLDTSFIKKLENLPRFIHQKFLGHSFLFIHYQLNNGQLHDHISKDPFANIVKPSLANMIELFGRNDLDLISFGHHHPVHYFRGMSTTYLNPGSLGCSEIPVARYAIVSLTNEGMDVELRGVPYNNTKFLTTYEKLKVPARDFILKIFHGNQLK